MKFAGWTYLLEVLETVDYKGFNGDALEHLVVVDHDGFNCWQAFDLRQQYERVQVVVRQDEFLKLRKLFQLVQVSMVHDQVKPHVVQVNLFNLWVKFSSLKNF